MTTFATTHATGSLYGQEWGRMRRLLPALRVGFSIAAAIFFLSPIGLQAATDDDTANNAQPAANARAVRLSSVEGQVRLVQEGQVIADPAYNNLPIFEGSQITTGDDGRAEIQMEDGSLVRLSPNSAVTFPVMKLEGTSTHTEVVLNSGLAYFELQPSIAEHSLRVSYGPASFSATGFSVVRIQMDKQPGSLAVFSGNVHLDRGDALQLDIHGGESLSLSSTDQARYDLADSIQPDSWDSWNADRDQLLNAQAGERTAATGPNSNAPGMSDLDANGNWYDVPGTGYVWSPYDAQGQGASFDPYGYGRWVNYPGQGYLWNSGYGWGYAPFQCGLWNYYDNFGWGWAPGGGGCFPGYGYGGYGYGGYGGGYYPGGGGYGNIGKGPTGYRPPRRPAPGPGHPHPLGTGSRELQATNIIPVDRRPAEAKNNNYESFVRPAQPATIGGHRLEPLQPVSPRPVYDRPVYDRPGNAQAGRQSGGYFPSPSRPSNAGSQGGAYGGSFVRPASPSGAGGSRPSQSFGGSRPSQSFGGGSRPSFSPSSGGGSHPSFSGGGASGGGGGHVSAGGGGGTHK
ncbi:MAG TPA: FecR family protein [Acidobacteriaceae bacterium]|jgi:hypothetical protein|nr:FecR family protein [Acidobacteriaceae bacterium]